MSRASGQFLFEKWRKKMTKGIHGMAVCQCRLKAGRGIAKCKTIASWLQTDLSIVR
jgi:hypothetical protein